MKKLLFPLAAALVLLSCSKNEIKNVQPAGPVTHSTARPPWLDCSYTFQYDAQGKPTCKRPWADCALFRNTIAVSYDQIDNAINNGPAAVQDFFNGDWQSSFPLLPDDDLLLASLQDGTNTMIRSTNSNGDRFYSVVPAEHKANTPAVYTVMVAAK